MGRLYATTQDFENWTGVMPAPDNTELLLRLAGIEVDAMLLTALYDTDGQGMPTDPAVVTALRDATCAQAQWTDETGNTTGAASYVRSLSLGSFSMAGGGGGAGGGGMAPAASPVTRKILASAGILKPYPVR